MRIPAKLPIALVLTLALVAAFVSAYRPPLSRESPGGFLSKPIDFLGFSWYHNRGFWLEALGDFQRARCLYLLSAWYRPSFFPRFTSASTSFSALSAEFEQCGEFTIAARLLELESVRDDRGDYSLQLANLYLRAARYEDAITMARRAASSDPSSLKPLEIEALSHERMGRAAEALTVFRRILSDDPDHFRALAGQQRLGTEEEIRDLGRKLDTLATVEIEADDLTTDTAERVSDGWALWRRGFVSTHVNTIAGEITLRVLAKGTRAINRWPVIEVTLDRQSVGKLEVNSESWKEFPLTFEVPTTDTYFLALHYINDFADAPTSQDRNLFIARLRFTR